MSVPNIFNIKPSLQITRTRIIRLRRWVSSLSSLNTDNEDVAIEVSLNRYMESNAGKVPEMSHDQNHIWTSSIKRLSKIMTRPRELQNKNTTYQLASSLNSSLSPDTAPPPGSICTTDTQCVDESKYDEFADSAKKINNSGSSCGAIIYSSDKAHGNCEVSKSLNKISPATIDQSKCNEFADSARNQSSEKAVAVSEEYKSSNKTSLDSAPSVSREDCKRVESIKDILSPIKSSCTFQTRSDNPKQNETKAKLKFVPPGTEKDDILLAFEGGADITKVEISDDGDVYRHACIYFKNKEELLKALKRTDLVVRKRTVVLEAASPMENICNKLPDQVLIGEQPVPSKIIKNASRTVMIRGIGCQISVRDIQKVLALCGSSMSGISFGPSSFSAYVEFATEDDKEMALAKQPVSIAGKQISILRIDTPRTTVVRVLYGHVSGQKVSSICNSLGKVKHFNWRSPGIVDVHYCFPEWAKMVDILNSLNGLDIDGTRVLAQPATDYPPDILSNLWNLPEERKHISKMVLHLIEKLRKNDAETIKLTSLAERFYSREL